MPFRVVSEQQGARPSGRFRVIDQPVDDRGTIADPLAQGASFGFADEVAGALMAIPAAVRGTPQDTGPTELERLLAELDEAKAQGDQEAVRALQEQIVVTPNESRLSTSHSLADAYRGVRDEARERNQAFAERNPKTAMAAEVAGGLFTGGAGAARAGLGTALRNTDRLGKVGTLAGAGSALGGTAGLGYSEGETLGDLAKDTATGAAVGAGAGVLLPPVARTLGTAVTAPFRQQASRRAAGEPSLGETIRHPLRARARRQEAQREQEPSRKLLEALERDELTPEQVQARLAKRPGASVMDVGGTNTKTLGETIASQPGKGARILESRLTQRQMGQSGRIDDALKVGMGSEAEFNATRAALERQMKEAARPLYQEAYAQPVRLTPALEKLLKRDSMRDAVPRGMRLAREQGDVIGGHMQALDYAKRGLDDKIGEAIRAGRSEEARAFTRTKRELVSELDEQVPVYAEARAAYAGPKQMERALDEGRKFIREDAENIASALAEMAPSEQQMFRIGATRALRDKVLSASDTADSYKRIFNNPLMREKIRAVFPDRDSFVKFARALKTESEMFETRHRVLGNSATARRLAGQQDVFKEAGLAGEATEHLINRASSKAFLSGNLALGSALRALPRIINQRFGGNSDHKREMMARILMETDPAKQAEMLRRVATPQRQQIPFEGSPFFEGGTTAAAIGQMNR